MPDKSYEINLIFSGDAIIKIISEVIEVKLDKDNPSNGYFELDWNNAFVIMLRDSGYEGSDDEVVVNSWFNDLCKTIVREDLEDEFDLLGESPNIVQLSDGRKEIR